MFVNLILFTFTQKFLKVYSTMLPSRVKEGRIAGLFSIDVPKM